MSLMKCHECATEISSEAKTCPKCGVKPKTTSNKISTIFGLILIVAAGFFFFGGGIEKQAAKEMAKIEQQVASDTIAQYEITRRHGNSIEVCVQAGLVSAAFLQAKDEANYKTWKTTQDADCKKAGIPL